MSLSSYSGSGSHTALAVIPAAGIGSRMQAPLAKQYLPLAGCTVLEHTLAAFLGARCVRACVLAVAAHDTCAEALCAPLQVRFAGRVHLWRCGGATRQDTVMAALAQARAEALAQDGDWVMVHDAARPGITPAMIDGLFDALQDDPVGGLLALPVNDTVKARSSDGQLRTVPRDGLFLAQTPQMFRLGALLDALQRTPQMTDEASAMEAQGATPRLVAGHPCNLKITLPADLPLAAWYLQQAARAAQDSIYPGEYGKMIP